MNLAICTVASYKTPFRNGCNFVAVTNALKQLYCDKFGHRFIYSQDNPRPEISGQWAKFSIILHAFKDHGADWAIWMDADAAPVNFGFDVAKFLETQANDKIIMAKDILGWNSGVFAVPNCPRAIEWLTMLDSDETVRKYDPYPQKYPFKDQDAIKDTLEGGYADFVVQPPPEIGWNSYDKIYGKYSDGMPNEFIDGQHWCLHIPGFYHGHRTKRFEYFLARVQNRTCPVCGMNASRYMSLKPEGAAESQTIYKCPDCGLMFDADRTEKKDTEEWKSVTGKAKEAFEKAEKIFCDRNISHLSAILAAHEPALLQLGMGLGLFADKLRSLGLSVDFEQTVAPFTVKRERDHRKYSMVVGDDVVQTTIDDAALFANVNRCLLKGGLFIARNVLSDKNMECLSTLPLNWPALNPEEWRVRLHTTKSIELLAAKNGFTYLPNVSDSVYQVFVKTQELG